MPILGDRKRTHRDRGSFIQHNSESPTKSPASKMPKSRKSLYENTSKNIKKADPSEKDMDKILQELELIRQGQKDIQDNQVKILERVGAVETELNSLKTEVESVNKSHENVKKVDMVKRNFQAMNFELNRLEQYLRKARFVYTE